MSGQVAKLERVDWVTKLIKKSWLERANKAGWNKSIKNLARKSWQSWSERADAARKIWLARVGWKEPAKLERADWQELVGKS